MGNDLHEQHRHQHLLSMDDHAPFSGTTGDQPLRRALEQSERFHRDTWLGGILHLGKHSFRELNDTDAVHITIDGNRISAHVDDVSPVKRYADGRNRYSWARIVVHNLLGISTDVARRMRGRDGEQRCNLDCEVVWVEDEETAQFSGEEPECHTCTDDEMPTTPAVGRDPLTLRKTS